MHAFSKSFTAAPKLGRLWGIDLARFLAVVGMVAAHLVASRYPWPVLETVTTGFPSTLFAVLGGFGVIFAARRYPLPQMRLPAVVAGLTRGALVLLVGLVLEMLPPHPIYVILIYYGVALMCVAPAILLPSWALVVIAAVLAAGGPFLIAIQPHSGSLNVLSPTTAVQEVFFGGTYPAVTWVVYLLAGMVLGRWMLRQREAGKLGAAGLAFTAGGILMGGSAWLVGEWHLRSSLTGRFADHFGTDLHTARQYLLGSASGSPFSASWDALFQLSPHSGSLVDITRTAGFSVAIVGACLLLTLHWTAVPAWATPMVGVGAAPLTCYTLHLIFTSVGLLAAGGTDAFFADSAPWWVQWSFLLQLPVLLIIGAALFNAGRRGPLEAAVTRGATTAAQAVA